MRNRSVRARRFVVVRRDDAPSDAAATVDDLETPRAMSYVRVKRKRARRVARARRRRGRRRRAMDYGEDGDDGARAARTARAAALARALDDALADGSRATPYGAAVTAEDAGGARKRRRRARRVAEGVARDDAETAGGRTTAREARRGVYDAMVDSLGVRRADGEAIERARGDGIGADVQLRADGARVLGESRRGERGGRRTAAVRGGGGVREGARRARARERTSGCTTCTR